jgi:drug/metabolite transporter (DMT)-like permease
MDQKNSALIKLLLALLTWSSSYSITRSVVADMPPILFAILRFAVATLILLTVLYFRKKPVKKPASGIWGPILVLSLTGVTLYYIFFNISLQHTSASTGALIQGFIPVAVAILAAIFLKEKTNALQITGIVISVAGVVLIGFMAKGGAGNSSLWGNLLMIAAILCWAVYTIVSKKYAAVDPLWLITCMSVVGTLLLVPAAIVEMWHRPFPAISLTGWGAILYMGIAPSALGYLWYNSALQHMSASQAGMLLNLDPIVGAVIAVIFLGEEVAFLQIVGAALVLTGVFMYMYKRSLSKTPVKER